MSHIVCLLVMFFLQKLPDVVFLIKATLELKPTLVSVTFCSIRMSEIKQNISEN